MLNKIIEEAKEEFKCPGDCYHCNPLGWADRNPASTVSTQSSENMRLEHMRNKKFEDFLSQSLTKGIQKAVEEIRLEKKPYDPKNFENAMWNSACDVLDTKINKLLK